MKTNAGLTRAASASGKLDDDGKNIFNLLAESTAHCICFPWECLLHQSITKLACIDVVTDLALNLTHFGDICVPAPTVLTPPGWGAAFEAVCVNGVTREAVPWHPERSQQDDRVQKQLTFGKV